MAQLRRNLQLSKVLDLNVRVGDHQPLPLNPLVKVIATVAADVSKDKLEGLINCGMSVLRCNLHHGSPEAHVRTLGLLREILDEQPGRLVATMVDVSGDARVGKIKDGTISIPAGTDLTITADESRLGDAQMFCVRHYPPLSDVVKTGSSIVMNDGVSSFTVTSVNKEHHTVRVRANSTVQLMEQKLVYLPGAPLNLEGVTFAAAQNVDFVAISVSSVEEIHTVRATLRVQGKKSVHIICKISNHEALRNVKDIIKESDGIMISRGDLGIIMPEQQVFVAQKHLVSLCNLASKPCIITTQMLYSMIRNPRPTRAEATDIANAVLDGADCMMLSSETEHGDYPKESLEMMVHICHKGVLSEHQMSYDEFFESMMALTLKSSVQPLSAADVVAAYAVRTALAIHATAMVTVTETGSTTRRLVKYRPPMPVIALTPDLVVARQMLITRSAVPFHISSVANTTAIIAVAMERAKMMGIVKAGDKIVAVVGDIEGQSGSSNTLKVMTVP